MTAAKNILRQMAEKAADDRAHRIASIAAEEIIRSEGESVGPDEFNISECKCDDHVLECIAHLKHIGEAVAFETDDGYIKVIFGDFTLSSLADEAAPQPPAPQTNATFADWLARQPQHVIPAAPQPPAPESAGLVPLYIGQWLSAALDDPKVCPEMKADIERFFAEFPGVPQEPCNRGEWPDNDAPEVSGFDPTGARRTVSVRWPDGEVVQYERADQVVKVGPITLPAAKGGA